MSVLSPAGVYNGNVGLGVITEQRATNTSNHVLPNDDAQFSDQQIDPRTLQQAIERQQLQNQLSFQEPETKFENITDKKLADLPENLKELFQKYKPHEAYLSKSGDKLVISMDGESAKRNLFDDGFFSSISNFIKGMKGEERTDQGLQIYKELFYNPKNHSGESPETLIGNLSHREGSVDGGHYYAQASFKLRNGKFKVDTITITDSAEYAARDLIKNGTLSDPEVIEKNRHHYLIKYILPADTKHSGRSIVEMATEITDPMLMDRKRKNYQRFYLVGSPKPGEISKTHEFDNKSWKFPLNENGNWVFHDGNLFVIQKPGSPINYDESNALTLAEMQTSHGPNAPHPNREIFNKCVEFNKNSLGV